MGFVIRNPTIEFGALSLRQGHGAVFGNAVPQLFDERQALFDAEPIDAERFK